MRYIIIVLFSLLCMGFTKVELDKHKIAKDLYELLVDCDVQYPDIVLQQAIHETSWFTSKNCRVRNNLFGLTNPRTKSYYTFSSWTESVEAYISLVQYRYEGGDYYEFLNCLYENNNGKCMRYAEDPKYTSKLKRLDVDKWIKQDTIPNTLATHL